MSMNTFFTGILRSVLSAVLAVAAALAVGSCADSGSYRRSEGAVWNTTFHICYRGPRQLDDSIHAVMKRVEMSLSPFNTGSLVSRLNRGENVAVDENFRQVFEMSKRVNEISGGAFDPTAAPLINLWGFGYAGTSSEPSAEMIDSVRQYVGIGQCHIDNNSLVRTRTGTTFNFSAVAKGYGCDEVARMLARNGCADYMVEIGGEIAVAGVNQRGEKWNIMIDAPVYTLDGSHSRMAVIEVTGCGVATSGNYRNYRDTPSGRIGHTINPSTGYPVDTSTLSATVIAPTCAMADAVATACMVLPAAEAMAMVEREPGLECLLVVAADDGAQEVATSSGFPAL